MKIPKISTVELDLTIYCINLCDLLLILYHRSGAFLIPYFVMLFIEGIPIFYLELAIGQRLRKGAIGVWNQVSPYMAGIGISSAVVSFNVALYYNTIIAWCLFYFVQVGYLYLSSTVIKCSFLPRGVAGSNPDKSNIAPTKRLIQMAIGLLFDFPLCGKLDPEDGLHSSSFTLKYLA